jgi:hypothetical protein
MKYTGKFLEHYAQRIWTAFIVVDNNLLDNDLYVLHNAFNIQRMIDIQNDLTVLNAFISDSMLIVKHHGITIIIANSYGFIIPYSWILLTIK